MGAIYSLFQGDLQTASQLGTQCVEETPYAIEAHVILVHAYSGLEEWSSAALHGRLALCLGVRDPQVGSFMAGVYRELGLTDEAIWVEEHCTAEPFEIQWDLDHTQIEALKRELSTPPRSPQRPRWGVIDHQRDDAMDRKIFSWGGGGSEGLPNWLEVSESLEMTSALSIQSEDLEWLAENHDSLEMVFRHHDPFPDWIMTSEPLSDITLESSLPETYRSPAQSEIEPHSSTDKGSREETDQHMGISSSSPAHPQLDELLLASSDHASLLGVGDHFKVAIDLEALTLTASNAKPKMLFGPLILALTDERLILVAYEEEFIRQKPWAFSPTQLLAIKATDQSIALTVEGEREIAFSLPNALIAARFIEIIDAWR